MSNEKVSLEGASEGVPEPPERLYTPRAEYIRADLARVSPTVDEVAKRAAEKIYHAMFQLGGLPTDTVIEGIAEIIASELRVSPVEEDKNSGKVGNTPLADVERSLLPAWDKSGLKAACLRGLEVGRTHQNFDLQLLLDMLNEIERLESLTRVSDSSKEARLVQAYESKVQDFARETLRSSEAIAILQDVDKYLEDGTHDIATGHPKEKWGKQCKWCDVRQRIAALISQHQSQGGK